MQDTSVLFAAIAAGDLAAVKRLVAGGVPAGAVQQYETGGEREVLTGARSALRHAVDRSQPAIVAFLLSRGADPDHRDPIDGSTALVAASAAGRAEIVDLLLGARARLDLTNAREGDDPFAAAVRGGHATIAQRLLAAGARPTVRALERAAWLGSRELGELCRVAGVGPPAAKVLDVAARGGRVEFVQWLLASGADLAAEGPGALVEAANAGRAEVVDLLVRAGVSPEACASFGWTALQCAAYNGNAATVRVLLQHGADPRVRDRQGATARDHAHANGRADIVAVLDEALGR